MTVSRKPIVSQSMIMTSTKLTVIIRTLSLSRDSRISRQTQG